MIAERPEQLRAVEHLREALGNVPIDEDKRIEVRYLGFPSGTHRESVWHWFEDSLGVSVVYLMHADNETEPWIN